MSNQATVRELLKNYRINRARISFIENQLKRFKFEDRVYTEKESDTGATVAENSSYPGTAGLYGLCNVMELEGKYDNGFSDAQGKIITLLENELNYRRWHMGLMEDALDMLKNMGNRYRTVVEEYYIKSSRMEDIAEEMHISRSKCYELCKEAVDLLEKIMFGNAVGISFENKMELNQCTGNV